MLSWYTAEQLLFSFLHQYFCKFFKVNWPRQLPLEPWFRCLGFVFLSDPKGAPCFFWSMPCENTSFWLGLSQTTPLPLSLPTSNPFACPYLNVKCCIFTGAVAKTKWFMIIRVKNEIVFTGSCCFCWRNKSLSQSLPLPFTLIEGASFSFECRGSKQSLLHDGVAVGRVHFEKGPFPYLTYGVESSLKPCPMSNVHIALNLTLHARWSPAIHLPMWIRAVEQFSRYLQDRETDRFLVSYLAWSKNIHDFSCQQGPFATFKLQYDRTCEWTGLKFSNDGKLILLSTNGGALRILDAFKGAVLHSFGVRENSLSHTSMQTFTSWKENTMCRKFSHSQVMSPQWLNECLNSTN